MKTLIALALTAAAAAPAWAGLVPDVRQLSDSSKVHDIEEVVVVALPKETYRLRQQPLSATSLAAADLASQSAHSLRDVALQVPSLVMPDYGSRLTSSIYMRGIGSRINSPGVGIYVDGIPLVNKSAFNFHLYDVARIDVLRGPQGTLYGQNTEGGLVRIQTLSPMDYEGTNVKLGIGSHFGRRAELSHYGKTGGRLGYSLAAFYNGTNGFLRNQSTGDRADQSNEAGARIGLQWKPSRSLSLALTADYQFAKQNGFAYGLLDEPQGTVAEPSSNYQGNYRRHLLNTGLAVNWQRGDLSLSSTTSWQYLDDHMLMDQDYLPEDYMHLEQSQLQNALTEELTLSNHRGRRWTWTFGAFASYQWLRTVAPVYFGEALTTPIAQSIQTSMRSAMVSAMKNRFVASGLSDEAATAAAERAIEAAGGVSMDVSMDVPGTFRTPNFNLGLYHESRVRLGERLTATVGLRYDLNHIRLDYDTQAAMAMTAHVMGTDATYTLLSRLSHKERDSFHQLLPKVGLTYALDGQGSNVYALVSKGYRAGGYNIQMFSDILQTELTANRSQAMRGDYTVEHAETDYQNVRRTITYKPESSWNYEVGAHLNLFGHRMQLDVSAFWLDILNQQLSVMAEGYGFGRMMVNAGKSRSIGAEVSLRGQALNNRLAWTLSYSLTQATFRQYTDSTKTAGQTAVADYKGNRVPYVPQHAVGATADYRFDLRRGAIDALTLGLNLSAQGNIYWDEANTYSQPFYALLGAHATATIGRTTLRLWGKNLTATRYNTFAISSSATGEKRTFAQRGWPLTFGIDAEVRL